MRAMHPRVQRNYLLEEKYWQPSLLTESYLFHCFIHCGTTSVLLCWFDVLLCGAVFVVFVWWLVFPFFSIWHKIVIRRLSPSSWWAQHRTTKKKSWRAPPAIFVATQQRTAKENCHLGASLFCCVWNCCFLHNICLEPKGLLLSLHNRPSEPWARTVWAPKKRQTISVGS